MEDIEIKNLMYGCGLNHSYIDEFLKVITNELLPYQYEMLKLLYEFNNNRNNYAFDKNIVYMIPFLSF